MESGLLPGILLSRSTSLGLLDTEWLLLVLYLCLYLALSSLDGSGACSMFISPLDFE